MYLNTYVCTDTYINDDVYVKNYNNIVKRPEFTFVE